MPIVAIDLDGAEVRLTFLWNEKTGKFEPTWTGNTLKGNQPNLTLPTREQIIPPSTKKVIVNSLTAKQLYIRANTDVRTANEKKADRLRAEQDQRFKKLQEDISKSYPSVGGGVPGNPYGQARTLWTAIQTVSDIPDYVQFGSELYKGEYQKAAISGGAILLGVRVKDLHQMLHFIKQERTATAIVEGVDASGNIIRVIGHSDKYTPFKEGQLIEGEVLSPVKLGKDDVGNAAYHAEQVAYQGALQLGITPKRISVAGQPICPECKKFIEEKGLEIIE